MEHDINRNYGGENINAWIQPVCKCGWEGRKEYAHNSYQHSNVTEQMEAHLRSTKTSAAI